VAPVRSRGIRNGLQPVLNLIARESPEVHIVSRECAFGKQHDVTACARRFRNEAPDEFDILRQSPAKLQLRCCDSENSCRHEISACGQRFRQ